MRSTGQPSLGLQFGPFSLDRAVISKTVSAKQIGNYVLGTFGAIGFKPSYVGRSDTDLQSELIANLPSTRSRTHFKFGYAESVIEAYEKECRIYHDFQAILENRVHPSKPHGENPSCPICGR